MDDPLRLESTTDTSTVVVTITGTNDTPDITVDAGNDQGTVTEDASTSAEGAPADQVNTLTLSGSYATDDTVTATVNNVDITHTVQDADSTLALVATGLANAINNSPNLVDVISASATDGVITITADSAGVPFSLPSTHNSSPTPPPSTAASPLTTPALISPTPVTSPLPISISPIPPTSHAPSSQLTGPLSPMHSIPPYKTLIQATISGAGVGSAAHSGQVDWTFSIDNALTQYLADQSIAVTYRITITDDSSVKNDPESETETQDVVITINGANDNPVFSVSSLDNSDAETLTETDAALTTSGTLTATDIDLTNTVSISNISVSSGDTTDGLISSPTELLNMLSVSPVQVLDGTQTVNQFTWSFRLRSPGKHQPRIL